MEVATSHPRTKVQTIAKQVTFQFANECDLEIHCSPFGLSGLYIKINGTDIMGIGSTMGLITGSTRGLIHYNDSNDLVDQKYKLYVVIDDDDMLRIDFTKIYTDASNENNEKQVQEVPTLIFRGKCPEGRPDNIEPFIGIFSFERET
ncbi:3-ketoacyl-coa thiolase, putative [Candida dubliniensis CD36]|uniref:3-ketoacyl-coa thiolase, putative n=1 Tax=Candida dubliniensis (strain CD36 / ATCC MYA-646 / CBS 7987 / NCPF 3949 / NRRL Y-17841) TaxID=573826 RepID=B9WKL1_CANDC|nr:3-ketoacyl-coa thiolase, putative [Candida dubliniensis CD36]CAX39559.1 3-ketoacyl-coa thiolase, putative [Candida dubliniensis CD36]